MRLGERALSLTHSLIVLGHLQKSVADTGSAELQRPKKRRVVLVSFIGCSPRIPHLATLFSNEDCQIPPASFVNLKTGRPGVVTRSKRTFVFFSNSEMFSDACFQKDEIRKRHAETRQPYADFAADTGSHSTTICTRVQPSCLPSLSGSLASCSTNRAGLLQVRCTTHKYAEMLPLRACTREATFRPFQSRTYLGRLLL